MTQKENRMLSEAMLYLELLKRRYNPYTTTSEIDILLAEYKAYVDNKINVSLAKVGLPESSNWITRTF